MHIRWWFAAFAAVWITAGSIALADADTRHRMFIIHPILTTDQMLVAGRGEPLVVQPITALAAAALQEDVRPPFLLSTSYPAGTLLFDPGFVMNTFCAERGALMTCFWSLGDGKLAYAAQCDSGGFGIPILAFGCRPMKKLRQPVRFRRLPDSKDGPSADFGVMFEVSGSKTEPDRTISIYPAIRGNGRWQRLGGPMESRSIVPGQPTKLTAEGLDIDVLDVHDDGSVDYRVNQGLPWRRAEVNFTVFTHWTVQFYHIP